MALKVVNTESLDAVANAINSKSGRSGALQFPDGFVEAVEGISAGGGGELPTLFAPTITLTDGDAKIAITDNKNGDFVEKYEVYIDGAKVGEVASKDFTIADITTSKETIEIFVKAIASLFNASEGSNVVVRMAAADGSIGLAYTVGTSSCTCTGIGSCTETDIIIASEIDGLPVKTIAKQAFDYEKITSVHIPRSVTTIQDKAFQGSNLTSLTLFKEARLYNDVFAFCTKLKNVTLENGFASISYETFYGAGIESIIIPNSVTNMSTRAFAGCGSLATFDMTSYSASGRFPTISSDCFEHSNSAFEILVQSGRKAELSAMTNWSAYADHIVEV